MKRVSGNLIELVGSGLEQALIALTKGNQADARRAYDQIKSVLSGRMLDSEFEDILNANQEVRCLSDRLYIVGASTSSPVLVEAWQFVTKILAGADPLVIVREVPGGARQTSELDGISVIRLAPKDAADRETVVHEFVHARVRSGHRMLDEGLAEWMGALAAFGESGAKAELRRRAEHGPALEVLAARRWTDQPCFEGLAVPRGSAHAVAALCVADLIETRGIAETLGLMERVERDRSDDIRALLNVEAVEPTEHRTAVEAVIPDEQATAIRRQFRTGDTKGASDSLASLRRLHLEQPNDEAIEEAYLITLLLAANEPDAERLRVEFDQALARYVGRRDDTAMAYALCVSREGLNIRYASDFIAMNESFERGRAIIEAALDDFDKDVDVLATAAKFEFHTPLEYGGNPARARAYLQRAVAVCEDPVLAAHFKAALDRNLERSDA
ncbi:hypothetical protein [Sphingomonas qomolangmaensis]|uniref:Tetratricopeptide repeat protein n=1 Tax=Sphingomonas qomolangmaensis TaxID=2918765 RepID=A0ABY5LA64_9SPHN|nr:hypothetical protein [Sphingomonas qomolangmaensis]UUL82503.1 hypothetical protein NMP03_15240 [Sphingomonas qomolangmaensis]